MRKKKNPDEKVNIGAFAAKKLYLGGGGVYSPIHE